MPNLLHILRARETRGPAAWATLGARVFAEVPARLQTPTALLAKCEPLALRSVLLGYTRCGRFLISYAFDSALRFELLFWRVSLGPGVGGAWRLPAGAGAGAAAAPPPAPTSPPRPALTLFASAPLFARADWSAESALGDAVDGAAVRVRVWEPPGGGCVVVLGALAEGGGGGGAAHVTVVPSPCSGGGGGGPPLAERAPGAGVLGAAPPSLSALHFSLAGPAAGALAPLVAPAGGCAALAGGSRAFRLLLPRANGALLAVTLGVRPAGGGRCPGDRDGGGGGGGGGVCEEARCCSICGGGGGGPSPPWLSRAAAPSPALFALLPLLCVTLGARSAALAAARLRGGGGDGGGSGALFSPLPPWGGEALAARADAPAAGCGWAEVLAAALLDPAPLARAVFKGAVEDAAGSLLRPLGFAEAAEHRAAFCGARPRAAGGDVGLPAGSDEAAAAVGAYALLLLVADHVLPSAAAAAAPGAAAAAAADPSPPGGAALEPPHAAAAAASAHPARAAAAAAAAQEPSRGGVKRTFGGRAGAPPAGAPPPLPPPSALLPWEGGAAPPPPPPPPPAGAPPPTRYVCAEDVAPPVRSVAHVVWDVARGGARVLSLARAPAALQPGLDAAAQGRTLGEVARGIAARARAGAAAGPWGFATPAWAATWEVNNDALLKGRSQRELVSPALPTAIVA
jgi:hypothetical protein